MTRTPSIAVYLERGAKRTIACAVDWPGWSRGGRDDDAALDALLASASRYARALASARVGFVAPSARSAFRLVARLPGNATTDFGAPGAVPAADRRAMRAADLRRTGAILRACWRAFDAAVAGARGKTLATGPRGGGRALDAIVEHVLEAERGYLGGLGWRAIDARMADEIRAAVLEGMAASARGEIPTKGPRGGVRWKPRFFARRLAWHALDHAWEIEDRAS